MKKSFVAPRLTEEESLASLTLGGVAYPVTSGRV